MSEATLQRQIAETLRPLFHNDSVLINDYRTPQTASRSRGPWAILAVADEITASPGDSWGTPTVRYGVYLTLLAYHQGHDEQATLDAFQAIRQAVIAALLQAAPPVRGVEADTAVGPYYAKDGEPDPDSIAQRLTVTVEEYEV